MTALRKVPIKNVRTELIIQLSTSLFFTITCEQALAFYEECGLGKTTGILRWGETECPLELKAMRGKVLHARFEGPGALFFASDNDDAEPMKGSALFLEMADLPMMQVLFSRLLADGTATVPLARQYWGTDFGMFVNKFGVQWMLNRSPA